MKISASVMVGKSSEKHNHEQTIETRHDIDPIMDFNVDEVLEYNKSYKEVFNEMCSPFIKNYNKLQKEKYEKDLERFNNGELKNKPKKSNKKYEEMTANYFDYIKSKKVFNKQQQKTEQREVVRSVIIELGNKHNKRDLLSYLGNGNIKDGYNEYKNILKDTVDDIIKEYPKIKFVGASIHPNESGAIGLHLDYIPFAEGKNGLISTNFDEAMKQMKKPKETTKYNKSDKAPIYFNNFRNFIDTSLKENAKKRNLEILEEVTKDREFKNHVSPSSYGQMMEKEIQKIEIYKQETIEEKTKLQTEIKELETEKEKALENAKYFLEDYLSKGYQEPTYKENSITKTISIKKEDYLSYTQKQRSLYYSSQSLSIENNKQKEMITKLQGENYILKNNSYKEEMIKWKNKCYSREESILDIVSSLLERVRVKNERVYYPENPDEAIELFHQMFSDNSQKNQDYSM